MRLLCNKPVRGFSLAELLISLAILGAIATFTIPKVLNSQQSGQFNAMAKESAAMVSEAYTLYQHDNGLTTAISMRNLTPYINYVRVDSTTLVNDKPGWGSVWCGTYQCLRLHNGGIIVYDPNAAFGGSDANNAVWFNFEPRPDIDSPGEGMTFFMYYNGRLTTWKDRLDGTKTSVWTYLNSDGTGDPVWFSWD